LISNIFKEFFLQGLRFSSRQGIKRSFVLRTQISLSLAPTSLITSDTSELNTHYH